MSGLLESANMTFKAATALLPHRRVKLTAERTVGYAGAGEEAIGVTEAGADAGDNVAVRDIRAPGHLLAEASGAFAVNSNIYGAADGKISTTVSGSIIGVNLEAATADGHVIEFLPN